MFQSIFLECIVVPKAFVIGPPPADITQRQWGRRHLLIRCGMRFFFLSYRGVQVPQVLTSIDEPAPESCGLLDFAVQDPEDRQEGWETSADDTNAGFDAGPIDWGDGGP